MIAQKLPFIGNSIIITHAKNPLLKGMQGDIIDETKHQIIVQINKEKKRIDKKAIKFTMEYKNKNYQINGIEVAKSTIERIKAKVKVHE